jgi:ribosomal protein S18 acetylase RimI-like enzyme
MSRESLIRPANAADIPVARDMMRRYQTWIGLDLCFQNFDAELAALPGAYVLPQGNLWIARDAADGTPLGIIAVKPLDDSACEMKRLWVEDAAKGRGVGRMLAQTAIEFARDAGYAEMRLDTLRTRMPAAVALYQSLGFRETAAYVHNPEPDVLYMSITLTATDHGS